ncbi:putative DNA polymerase [Frankliniella fusca]|uniref:DNA-directed DNA polymerase n=1 Tax=Frankliniella fusca TaxID=407009 RepID=A0AAE1HK68_9NEOP|nr:putative DNA polymerase [Frankliniella fusca]
MDSTLLEILDEWEEGMFPFPELLTEAYSTFLGHLIGASAAERNDPRVIPFLLAGYTAYVQEQAGADPHAALTYRMALAMCGTGANAPPRPSTPPPPCPATPPPHPASPGPSRSTAKRLREEDEEEVTPTIEVLQSRERELKRFKAKFREETMQINGLGNTLPSEEVMEGLFNTVLQRQREAVGAKDDDRVIVEIQDAENVDNPLWFSMRRADQLSGRVVLDKLARVLNSNQAFMAQGQLKVSYIHIPTPKAGGRRTNRVANETMEQWIERKTGSKGSIYSPENTDNMCLTRCVAVLMTHGGMSKFAFMRLKKPDSIIQRDSAKKLCENAHIDPAQPCGLDEVRQLQDSLPDYRLCVFTDKDGKECVFKGPYGPGRKYLCLLLHNNHFYAILYPLAAFDRHFTCDRCVVFYSNRGDHRCEALGRKGKEKRLEVLTVYYDIETTQHTPVEGKPDTYEHIPNLLVSQAVCKECAHIPHNDYFCTVCQTRQRIFHSLDDPNLNVIGQFFDYLQSFKSKTKILLVAHNSRSFDGVFMVQEVVKRKLKCDITLQGAKILCMEVGNWKFIDSLMFLPMPLSAMPKSFGLNELKKGYWPFMANKPEYYTYEGPLLDKSFYCISTMKQKAAADFTAWHDEQTSKGFVFNFRRELIEYCISDDSGENRYEKTQQLTSLFRRNGFTVVEKWECEFELDLTSDPDTKAYLQAHPTARTPPLGLRDALAGGRTSALKWHYKADLAKGEKIKMVDVVSEYPNANLRGEYPYGHPTFYLEGDPHMPPPDTWNGVVKCTVLPPRDLFLPILPYKAKGKLMFPLCRTCVEPGVGNGLCLREFTASSAQPLLTTSSCLFNTMEELVADEHVDASVERMNSDGSPLVSSGVSSEGSRKSQPAVESPTGPPAKGSTATVYPCNHLNCRSVLKTLKGFQNHTFLHNISVANLKKPNMEFLLSCVPSFVSDIFQEILTEPNLAEEKREVVDNMIASEGSANFLWFCESISDLISTPILQRTKLLPSNQYEEVLSGVNHSLNNEETFEDLRCKACFLIPENYHSSKYLRNVLFRLCFRLCELVQIQVLEEMKESQDDLTDPAAVEVFQNKEEEGAFDEHMRRLFKVYYAKAQSVCTPVWNARCLCMRRMFFYCGDNDLVTENMLLDPEAWKDGSVTISKAALEFFVSVETVIALVFHEQRQYSKEIILEYVLKRINIFNNWHRLTSGYFSESDALIFMKDVVLLYSDFSIRLEEKRLKIQEQEKKKLPKFSLRSHLKKNWSIV